MTSPLQLFCKYPISIIIIREFRESIHPQNTKCTLAAGQTDNGIVEHQNTSEHLRTPEKCLHKVLISMRQAEHKIRDTFDANAQFAQ